MLLSQGLELRAAGVMVKNDFLLSKKRREERGRGGKRGVWREGGVEGELTNLQLMRVITSGHW